MGAAETEAPAVALLSRALELGILLRVEEDWIVYRPKSGAPEEFVIELRENKNAVLHLLRRREQLLNWASRLAEEGLELPVKITYEEAPLRIISTTRVSDSAAHYLTTIFRAQHGQRTGGWGKWTSEWWKQREEEAMHALTNLRYALNGGTFDP